VAGRPFEISAVTNRMLVRWWTTSLAPAADARFVYLGRLGPDVAVAPAGWFVSRGGGAAALAFDDAAEARAAAEALVADGDIWYVVEARPLAPPFGPEGPVDPDFWDAVRRELEG
jgi:hypothetical protein